MVVSFQKGKWTRPVTKCVLMIVWVWDPYDWLSSRTITPKCLLLSNTTSPFPLENERSLVAEHNKVPHAVVLQWESDSLSVEKILHGAPIGGWCPTSVSCFPYCFHTGSLETQNKCCFVMLHDIIFSNHTHSLPPGSPSPHLSAVLPQWPHPISVVRPPL